MEPANNEKSNRTSSLISRLTSDTAILLALVPFAFSLIVFMFQVGKFLFYDIPFEYISISLGQLFTVWFGLFIAVGVFGFTAVDLLIGIVHKFKLHRVFVLVILKPLAWGLTVFLIFFPIAPELTSAIYLGLIGFFLMLLGTLVDPLTDKDKTLRYLDRIELSENAEAKKNDELKRTNNAWQIVSGKYYGGFFFLYLILGVPCKIGYMVESTGTRQWVDDLNHSYILIEAQSEYYLLKEYDSVEKILKPGYIIRPLSDNETRFIQVETGVLGKPKI